MFPQAPANNRNLRQRHRLLAWALLCLIVLGLLPTGTMQSAYAAPLQQDGTSAQQPTRKRRTSGVTLTPSAPKPQEAARPQPSPTPAASRPAASPSPTPAKTDAANDPAPAESAQPSASESEQSAPEDQSANGAEKTNENHTRPATTRADADRERAEHERVEKARVEKERVERERVARESEAKERDAKERAEKERMAKELESARAEKERLEKERAERERADTERRAAAEGALDREIKRAQAEAAERERTEAAARYEKERAADAVKLEEERKAAAEKLAAERSERERLDKERAAATKQLEEAQRAAEADKTRLEAARAAERERAERSEREQQATLAHAREEESRRQRQDNIIKIAREMNFVDPLEARSLVPDDAADIRAALKAAAAAKPELVKIIVAPAAAFCDPRYVGEPYSWDAPDDVPLEALLTQLRFKYGINFMPDTEVLTIPVRVQVQNVPWNKVLRSVLEFNDLDASCGIGNTVMIVKRTKMTAIQDSREKSAPLIEDYIKLKYLQPSAGGLVNIAGKPQGGAKGTYELLDEQITKLLQQGGDSRGVVSRVPGKNILYISTTEEKMRRIKAMIAAADKPSYQVFVQASVYTTNSNRLKDIGVQSSVILSNGLGDLLGGVTTLPPATQGGSSSAPPSGINPGGVGGLAAGMRVPSNGLSAATPNTVFGLSAIVGTSQFTIQATALAQNGVIKIDSRPATLVLDGETASLNVGRQIPVVVQAINPQQGGLASGQLDVIDAGSVMQVSPTVAEDENGNPAYVTLDLRLEANDADTSITTSGDIPSVVRRAIQTRLRLKTDQTVVIGGFTTDTTSKQRSKTPGLGDIPIFGNLFKRRLEQETRDRLYFAISVKVIPQDAPLVTVEPTLNTNLPAPESKIPPTQPATSAPPKQ